MIDERLSGDLSARTGFTAQPPQNCLNGCQRGSGDARGPVLCEPGMLLCDPCQSRLDTWLRAIPDAYALLPAVQDHGTVPGNPETARTKQPDAPAPMRLEVTDLLDTRNERGALGILHAWANAVRDERRLPRRCTCNHARPSHGTGRGPAKHHCTAAGCGCSRYHEIPHTMAGECALLLAHLAWCAQQDWAGDLYDELRILQRQLADTVGDYRAKPVGKCAALTDRPGAPVPVLCGGALVMDRTGHGVHCVTCGTRHEANAELRELGLIVGAMFGDNQINQEAS